MCVYVRVGKIRASEIGTIFYMMGAVLEGVQCDSSDYVILFTDTNDQLV